MKPSRMVATRQCREHCRVGDSYDAAGVLFDVIDNEGWSTEDTYICKSHGKFYIWRSSTPPSPFLKNILASIDLTLPPGYLMFLNDDLSMSLQEIAEELKAIREGERQPRSYKLDEHGTEHHS